MTQKKMKTEDVLKAYNVLSTAKYGKLDDADKIKVWKIARSLKPVAEKFREDSEDAQQKMKPNDDFDEQLMKAQEYEREIRKPDCDASKLPMGAAQYQEFVDEFKAYQKLVNDTIKDFAEKEVTVEFEPISEDAFGKLMASNDWTLEQVATLGEIICG
jgi:hypothetical protein